MQAARPVQDSVTCILPVPAAVAEVTFPWLLVLHIVFSLACRAANNPVSRT